MKTATGAEINNAMAAAAIRVLDDRPGGPAGPGVLGQPLLLKASAILAVPSLAAGVLNVLLIKGMIGPSVRDFLIGIYYIFMFGGALWFSGRLDAKRAATIVANVIVFQAWNTVFNDRPQPASFGIVIELWLPVYWTWTDPGAMEKLGLGRKGLFGNLAAGLLISLSLMAYFAWGMTNYGFTLDMDMWKIVVNVARGLPMNLSIFAFIYTVWSMLRARGLSPAGALLALAVLSFSLNAPVYTLGAVSASVPMPTALAGFIGVIVLMVLSTHLTFRRFRSALPGAFIMTSITMLLLIAGLL